jgi:hypothetical protein
MKIYLKDTKNFDTIKEICKNVNLTDDDGEDLDWIKHEKEWPEYLVLQDNTGVKLQDDYEFLKNPLDHIGENYIDTRIKYIDNEYTQECDYGWCDYCKNSIDDVSNYYRCYSCAKDMCLLCFEEKTEDIAIKNGAKNWHQRKDALLECFGHSDHLRNADATKLKLFENFNSLVELVPIVCEKEDSDNIILQNCNPSSKKYKTLYIQNMDDHGRLGIFECKDENLTSLMDKFTEYKRFVSEECGKRNFVLEGWDKFYNTPLKKYLEDNLYQTYYG